MKKEKILDTIWKYCRIILIEFVFIVFLLSLMMLVNSILRILPLGFSEEQMTIINTILFWYSVVLMLVFPPFVIMEIIIERAKELKSND